MKKLWAILPSLFVLAATAQNSDKGFSIVEKPAVKQVEILYQGKLLTAYRYDDSIFKPVLFPVKTVDGIIVTRGYPLEPRKGERSDHPHHIGVWLNYESVNGLDFWNNSTAIPGDKRNSYGTILHQAVLEKSAGANSARLVVAAKWVRPNGELVLNEKTTYQFKVVDKDFYIERSTRLTADKVPVLFKDVKDGLFAIRVARELEQPSTEAGEFIDVNGNKTEVPALPTEGITGMYTSSNGRTGDSVWSSQGTWVMLQGTMEQKKITIGIFDHPSSKGYPSYWHARGYGLFSVNPLGRAIFSKGTDNLNLQLKPGESVNFKYTLLVGSGHEISAADMDQLSKKMK